MGTCLRSFYEKPFLELRGPGRMNCRITEEGENASGSVVSESGGFVK